jgi:hypothetical protein
VDSGREGVDSDEITDAFGEFQTDINDDYRGVNDINAFYSYYFRFLL